MGGTPFCASSEAAQPTARTATQTKRLTTVGEFYNNLSRWAAVNDMVLDS